MKHKKKKPAHARLFSHVLETRPRSLALATVLALQANNALADACTAKNTCTGAGADVTFGTSSNR